MKRKTASLQTSDVPASSATEERGAITRRDVLALLAAFGVPDGAFAATDKVLANDPVAVSPKSYRVVFENDRVRVLDYKNRPGMGPCGRGLHYHPAHVDIVLSDFTAKLSTDGKVEVGNAKVGDVFWYEAETHEAETIGKGVPRIIMVELKDAKWKPSTG